MKKEENRMQVQILLEKVEKMEGSVNIGIRKKGLLDGDEVASWSGFEKWSHSDIVAMRGGSTHLNGGVHRERRDITSFYLENLPSNTSESDLWKIFRN